MSVSIIETAIRDSQLFTQVEPEWLAETEGKATYVNTSCGVVLRIDRTYSQTQTARVFYSDGTSDTYRSSGYYSVSELLVWWFPVIRNRDLWSRFQASDSGDISELA